MRVLQSPLALSLFSAPAVLLGRLARDFNPYDSPTAPELVFPGDLTRGLELVWAHSHNDYWRDVPLYSALSRGIMSVEADVWLGGEGKVHVGHSRFSLSDERRFDNLYVDQLLRLLNACNTFPQLEVEMVPDSSSPLLSEPPWNGLFTSDRAQALQLLVDIKTAPLPTLHAITAALEPLRERGWLTTYRDGVVSPGPVTVILTGFVPHSHLAPLRERDVYVDAPIRALDSPFIGSDGKMYEFNSTLAPLTSDNWATLIGWDGRAPASAEVLRKIEQYSEKAHERGMKIRWWNNPSWPYYARDAAWRTMSERGVDFLNADDLDGVAGF